MNRGCYQIPGNFLETFYSVIRRIQGTQVDLEAGTVIHNVIRTDIRDVIRFIYGTEYSDICI